MITDEQAEPITAEWCREHGATMYRHEFRRDGKSYWGAFWVYGNVVVGVIGGEHFRVNGREVTRKLSRAELLAIVTALKGGDA